MGPCRGEGFDWVVACFLVPFCRNVSKTFREEGEPSQSEENLVTRARRLSLWADRAVLSEMRISLGRKWGCSSSGTG